MEYKILHIIIVVVKIFINVEIDLVKNFYIFVSKKIF
jgi:hypothetical protein